MLILLILLGAKSVDEEALAVVAYLIAKIAGAGLDVFEREPSVK